MSYVHVKWVEPKIGRCTQCLMKIVIIFDVTPPTENVYKDRHSQCTEDTKTINPLFYPMYFTQRI